MAITSLTPLCKWFAHRMRRCAVSARRPWPWGNTWRGVCQGQPLTLFSRNSHTQCPSPTVACLLPANLNGISPIVTLSRTDPINRPVCDSLIGFENPFHPPYQRAPLSNNTQAAKSTCLVTPSRCPQMSKPPRCEPLPPTIVLTWAEAQELAAAPPSGKLMPGLRDGSPQRSSPTTAASGQ